MLTKAARQEQVAVTDKQLERVLEPLRQKSVDDLLSAVERRQRRAARGAGGLHPELKRTEPRKDELETPGDPAAAAGAAAAGTRPARR